MEAVDPDISRGARFRRGRLTIAAALVAVVAVAVVPALIGGDDDDKLAVRAGMGGVAETLPELELPTTVAVETTAPDLNLPPTAQSVAVPTSREPRPVTLPSSPVTVTTVLPVTTTPTSPRTTPTTMSPCPPSTAAPHTLSIPGLYVVPIDGTAPRRILADTGLDPNDVVASPDGNQLIFTAIDPDDSQAPFEIYTVGVNGTGLRRIDTEAQIPQGLVWSPDGRWIALHDQAPRGSDVAIWIMAPDGSQRRKLFEYPPGSGSGWLRWSPDSTRIATGVVAKDGGAWVIDAATGAGQKVVDDPVWMVDWSPGSDRLVVDVSVYVYPTMTGPQSNETAPVIVINADGTGRRQLVPQGIWSVWSPAGDGIAIRDGYLIDPDTGTKRSYGTGSAMAYSANGEYLAATGGGIWINDRRGCGRKILNTDEVGSPAWRGWAGPAHVLVESFSV